MRWYWSAVSVMGSRRIQLFYDVISPYSWFGFEALCRYRKRWSINLELCPFYLGGIMGGSGNRPPGMVPAKAEYMSRFDVPRHAKYFQVPLHPPSDPADVMFNKGSLKAQRFLVAVESVCPSKLENISRQLWMRVWSRDEDIVEDTSLREAGEKAGLEQGELDDLLQLVQTSEIKDKLKKRTQEALDLGCFGSPFIVAHMDKERKETFFGVDSLELLAFVIGEKWEGPLTELKAQL